MGRKGEMEKWREVEKKSRKINHNLLIYLYDLDNYFGKVFARNSKNNKTHSNRRFGRWREIHLTRHFVQSIYFSLFLILFLLPSSPYPSIPSVSLSKIMM